MNNMEKIDFRDITQIQNLMSLARILLTPILGYLLWLDNDRATLFSVVLLLIAATTDYLDGYLARKLHRFSTLGLILDPLADKIFAFVLIIELVFLRGFPIWLAVLIFLRDIIILFGASLMYKKGNLIPSSINSGKYYFASLAILIASYVIKFPFGQKLFLLLAVILFVISSFEYARNFVRATSGRKIDKGIGNPIYKYLRGILIVIITAVYLYKLFIQFIGF
jgi:cardiolipin synthase